MEAIFSLTFKLMSILFIFCRERGVGTVLCVCVCVGETLCVCVCVCVRWDVVSNSADSHVAV